MSVITRRRRHRGALASVLTAVSVLATACSGSAATSQDDASQSAHKPGQKVNLTFWSWVPGVDKAVAVWNAEHPDIQVKLEKIPAGSTGGYAKMRAALKAGKAPELAQVEYQEIPSFLLEEGLVDLGKYGVNKHRDQFVGWQWQQGVFGDGVYAVPQASGPMGMFYRADLYKKWGITPPKTWQEFEQAAKKVRAADPKAYISTFPPGNSAWFTALAWQAGAKWFDVKGDTWVVNIDTPQTRKVAAYWDRLRQQKLIKTEPDFANGWYKDLQKGGVVSWVSAQWGDAIISGNAPKTAGKWRAAPMPQWSAGRNDSANWGGSSTAVLKGAKHVPEAMQFAVWLNTDPKSVDLLIQGGYGWPAAKGAFRGSALDKPSAFFGGQKYNELFAESDKHIDKSWKWIPTIGATYQHLNDGFQAAASGKGTFVDAVRQAQKQTVEDLKSKGLKVATGQ
ncbi:ABC transporter substrate-binding protein [Streptomyces sp. KR80]|uniref:ABC transporter substrate-binding protein n=1 Tax=Streptomyces sp. KR80 TaxID=3457426 RepID=UPI003FD09C6F